MKVLLSLSWACLAAGFVSRSPSFVRQSALQSSLTSSVIKGEEMGKAPFDEGQGGVRLATDSAIKVKGTIKHKPGQTDPNLSDLVRYTKVTELDEATVKSSLGKARIVCTGKGHELYKDPGETIEAEVTMAPMDAAKDAFNAAGSLSNASKIVFNYLGGPDLQLLEVTDAIEFLIKDCLDINTKAKIYFNSMCHMMFPDESVTLTIVAVDGDDDQDTGGTGIANGEVYFRDGKWYTLDKADIDTALA